MAAAHRGPRHTEGRGCCILTSPLMYHKSKDRSMLHINDTERMATRSSEKVKFKSSFTSIARVQKKSPVLRDWVMGQTTERDSAEGLESRL